MKVFAILFSLLMVGCIEVEIDSGPSSTFGPVTVIYSKPGYQADWIGNDRFGKCKTSEIKNIRFASLSTGGGVAHNARVCPGTVSKMKRAGWFVIYLPDASDIPFVQNMRTNVKVDVSELTQPVRVETNGADLRIVKNNSQEVFCELLSLTANSKVRTTQEGSMVQVDLQNIEAGTCYVPNNSDISFN